jgi:hypothetical protein
MDSCGNRARRIYAPVAFDTVVDGKRKTLGETPVVGKYDLMNPRVDEKRLDIREETLYEIRSKPWLPAFVELEALNQILLGFIPEESGSVVPGGRRRKAAQPGSTSPRPQ